MKKTRRKIHFPDETYEYLIYRGDTIVVWDPQGKKHITNSSVVTGRSWDVLERGHHKRTCDAWIQPHHIKAWIEKTLRDQKIIRALDWKVLVAISDAGRTGATPAELGVCVGVKNHEVVSSLGRLTGEDQKLATIVFAAGVTRWRLSENGYLAVQLKTQPVAG